VRTVINRIKEFSRDTRGNFALMFAIVGTVLLMSAAVSIDVARMFLYQNKLNFAVDAAALATTQGLTLGDIALEDAEDAVRKYLDANLDGRNLTDTNVKIDGIYVDPIARTVQIDAHTDMPMSMAGVVGYENHRVEATSKAKFSNTEIEVAMALDVTGSMDSRISGTYTKRITALKSAATLAVNTLLADDGTDNVIRVGLVPYSEAVNAAPVIDDIETTGLTKRKCSGYGYSRTCWWETTYPDCVAERTGPEKHTDKFADATAKITSSDYSCPSAQIMPLTDNDTALNNRIDSFSTGGWTAGHIAIAWTYYMLSSKWNAAWPDGSDVQDFDFPGVSKYAIIMTDGEFNTVETEGEKGTSDGATSSRNYALGLCTAMKNNGIKVYSIAFGAGTSAANLMKSCANTDTARTTYFYNTSNQAELEAAFKQIADDIKGLRLIN